MDQVFDREPTEAWRTDNARAMARTRLLFRLVVVLFVFCAGLAVVVLWLLVPRATYMKNIRTQQLEIIGPGQDRPGVTISCGPNGDGAIVVHSGNNAEPAVLIAPEQHSAGVITLLAPTSNGNDPPPLTG